MDLKQWKYWKTKNECRIYHREAQKNIPSYRIDTDFPDIPYDVVFNELEDLEKQKNWGGDKFDELYYLKSYSMNTRIVYSKLKSQWPLGNRDLMNVYQVFHN